MNKCVLLLTRWAVGCSMFGHGLVRLPKLQAFSDSMVTEFVPSMLPPILVLTFSYVLPVLEFLIGFFLLIGLFTRISLMVGALVMCALIFGTCMIEHFNTLSSQFIHLSFFVFLLQYLDQDHVRVDNIIKKTKS